jgi:hypothetical protein
VKRKSLMISSMDNLERCPSVLSLLSLLRMCSYALSTGMAVNSDTTSNEIIISSSSMVVLISLLVKSVELGGGVRTFCLVVN